MSSLRRRSTTPPMARGGVLHTAMEVAKLYYSLRKRSKFVWAFYVGLYTVQLSLFIFVASFSWAGHQFSRFGSFWMSALSMTFHAWLSVGLYFVSWLPFGKFLSTTNTNRKYGPFRVDFVGVPCLYGTLRRRFPTIQLPKKTPSFSVEIWSHIFMELADDKMALASVAVVNTAFNVEAERVLYAEISPRDDAQVYLLFVALTSRPSRRRLVRQFRLTRQGYERSKFTFVRFDHYGYLLSMLVNLESLQIHVLADPYSLLLQSPDRESKLQEMMITSNPFTHWDVLLIYFQRNPELRRIQVQWEPQPVLYVPLVISEMEVQSPSYPEDTTLSSLEEVSGPWEIVKVLVPGRPVSKVGIVGALPPTGIQMDSFCDALEKSSSSIHYFKFSDIQVQLLSLCRFGLVMPLLEELHISDIDRVREDVSRYMDWGMALSHLKSLHTLSLTLRGGDCHIIFSADCEISLLNRWSQRCQFLERVNFSASGQTRQWKRLSTTWSFA